MSLSILIPPLLPYTKPPYKKAPKRYAHNILAPIQSSISHLLISFYQDKEIPAHIQQLPHTLQHSTLEEICNEVHDSVPHANHLQLHFTVLTYVHTESMQQVSTPPQFHHPGIPTVPPTPTTKQVKHCKHTSQNKYVQL